MDNFKVAVRALRATPVPTLVVIVTLAIAIGANTAIFTVVNGVLLEPIYGDDESLMVLWATTGSETSRLSPPDYRDLRDTTDAFDGRVALYRSIGSTLTDFEEPVQVGSYTVTARLFRTLDVSPALGRFFTDADEVPGGPRRVVITHQSWTRRFGSDPNIIGTTVGLDGRPFVVVAVTEPGFQFPPGDDEAEMYFAMPLSDQVLLDRDHRMFDAIGRLADGVTQESAQAEIGAMAAELSRRFPDSNEGWGMTLRPLRSELLGDLGPTLWVLAGAVFMVLLTACANIANVLVARSSAAGREFAVRAALGARPSDLCKRSLAESAVLGGLGGLGGIGVAFWGVSILRGVMPADIPRAATISIDGRVLVVALGLSLGATLLFVLLPALRSMSPQLHDLLKPAGALQAQSGSAARVREVMVVAEVGLAIVLLVAAGLMVRSFARLSRVDPGFAQDGVVAAAVKVPTTRQGRAEWRPFFEGVVDQVGRAPGVLAAGAVSDLPMSEVGIGLELEFAVEGYDAVDRTANPYGNVRLATPGYFDAMGMRIVAGRTLRSGDSVAERMPAVVNETLANRYFQEHDPIGRSITIESLGPVEIVGVVADIRHGGLASKYESEIFVPYGRIAGPEMHIVVRSSLDTAAAAAVIRDTLKRIDPEIAPRDAAAISDLLWESAARPRFNTALLSGLALCAALLAAVGTYGIVAYSVSQRVAEIGIRMALGADSAATRGMIVKQALRIVGIGALVGLLGALGATRFLTQLLFETGPTDPLTYLVVLGAALAVGLVAAWVPARRATKIDPVVALRER
ncbi:MAG: FtsX-like permease family protein [Acidobacteria bacterium]|nr:FtsX-like permease family protein [Acidobacteriota bacterium]